MTMIRMPELWGVLDTVDAQARGSPAVVAVVDSGYRLHTDLTSSLLIDEGYDFVSSTEASGDGDGIDPDALDTGVNPVSGLPWHGTTVAGVIAALTGNAKGVAGIGFGRVRIMPIRVLGSNGEGVSGTSWDIAQGILYAAGLANASGELPSQRADVINLSLGMAGTDEYMTEVLARAVEAGCIIVAAAGNDGRQDVDFPASLVETIAVSAVDMYGDAASYTNTGREVDVAAPGGDGSPPADYIAVPYIDPADEREVYVGVTGTSVAAPHVAGVLALLCYVDPSLDLSSARDALARASSHPLGVEHDEQYGYGILDALATFESYTALSVDIAAAKSVVPPSVPDAIDLPAANAAHTTSADGEIPGRRSDPNSLIVGFQSPLPSPKGLGDAGLSEIEAIETTPDGTARLLLRPGSDVDRLRKALNDLPGVKNVQPNYIYHAD
jgi:serine protease